MPPRRACQAARPPSIGRVAGWLVAVVCVAAASAADGRAQDLSDEHARGHARADALPPLFAKHRPFKPRIHWLPDGAGLWFETDTAEGRRCTVIDAATGGRREGATPAALGLVEAPPELLPPRAARERSRGGGGETEILLVNAFDRPVRIFWIDPDGRPRPYGTLPPGGERRQHTFARHVWLGDFAADDLAGVFVAGEHAGRAVFDEGSRRLAMGGGPARRVERDDAEAAEDAAAAGEAAAAGKDGGRREPRPAGHGRTVFVRDHDLVLRDAAGEHRLTTDGAADDSYAGEWAVSPDGTRAFGFQTAPAERRELVLVESSPRDALQPRVIRRDYPKPGDRIAVPKPRLFDLVGRRRVPVDESVFPDPWSIDRVHWAEDSREVFCLYNRRGHQVVRLVGIDAATGRVRTVVEEASATFVDYSQKTFLHWLPGSREAVWASERDGFNHLLLVDVAAGSVRPITSGAWNVRDVVRVDAAARQAWFTALGIHPGEDPYHRHLARVSFDGGGPTVLTAGDGTHEWTFSPDGGLFIDRWSRVDQPWVTQLRRAADGGLVAELGRDDASALEAAGFRPPERFTAKGRDGTTDIHGIIIRPTTFAAGRAYPLIEDIYAGPQDHHVPKAWGFSGRQRAVAEMGFIVVMIDGMGTNWRGKAFHDVCWRNLADAGLPDRIAWMRAAAAVHPELDLGRVGVYGGSAGGQNALAALLHHGDFYDAAVADCGCHDNRMDKIWWNEAWMGWPVGPEYAANSNVTHAAKLRGKLLLTVGELDTNVDPSSTLQVVRALIDAGRDFECVVVPGGGHGVGETPYLVRRRQDFFVRALLGDERRP